MESDSLKKQPCPSCRKEGRDKSGDNLVVYPNDRGAHCFSCGFHQHGSRTTADDAPPSKGFDTKKPLRGTVEDLPHRRIDKRTCRLFDYRTLTVGDKQVEVANYFNDEGLQAQHIRYTKDGKKFFGWRGETRDLPLFGQHLWNGKGKRIVVTEGEIDAMTVSELWSNRWPVVSIPNGVDHAVKAIRTNLTFLSGYDEIVLCFDNDEPGREAAVACAELLPPGKVKIVTLPYKDANECHLRGETRRLMSAIYEARAYQPDGVLHAADVGTNRKIQKIWTFPWRSLTQAFMGQRSGEITLYASGTGSGKSTFTRELVYHHLQRGRRVGAAFLEESPIETLDDLIGLRLNAPVRQQSAAEELNKILESEGEDPLDFEFVADYTPEEYEQAKSFFKESPLFFYDHHGTTDFNNILQRIEYMAVALECDVIIVDHVTAVVAGMEQTGSERQTLDEVMRAFRSIVERTGCHIDVVSQLNRLTGKPAEEGGRITLNNLRGSGSLGSVPNTVIAIERDQQADDPEERNIVKIRALKGRFTGGTGMAGCLRFDTVTRRLVETDWKDPHESGPQHEPVGDLFAPAEEGPPKAD